jgi:hypothetical protein
MNMIRASHAFVCVDLFVDGKRLGRHGTLMKAEIDATTCKELLNEFLQRHASACIPLIVSSIVVLMCEKISDTGTTMLAHDFGSSKGCSIFLDHLITMAMVEVPIKRFTYKCASPIKD